MEILIGKASICDYVVDNDFVSREHCKFIIQNDIFYILDLNSTNGTFINGEKIEPNKKIEIKKGIEIILAANYELDWNTLARFIPNTGYTIRIPEEKLIIKSKENLDQAHKEPSPQKEKVIDKIKEEKANYNRHQGLGSEVTYAMHSNKSYIGSAFLTWIMYYLGFGIVGLIMNIAYLNSAGKTKRIINRNPPGYGCLVFLLIIHLIVPIILIMLASAAGVSIFEYVTDLF